MGSPAIVIAAARKRGAPSMPPPEDGAPPKSAKPPMDENGDGQKHSVAEAHKVGADEHCKDCQHYQAESWQCEEVDGQWEPEDACVKYFEAAGGEGGDDEEAGESPDMEAGGQEPQQ